MNKAELIAKVAKDAEVSNRDAVAVVDAALASIGEALIAGDTVKLSGFGIFSVKARAARTGTNPANGEKIEIPAAKNVVFKVSKGLKEELNK